MNRITISPMNRTARPSLFGSSLVQSHGFHPTLAGRFMLGTTPEEWYQRAKASIAKFDTLVDRIGKIASEPERKNLVDWIGNSYTVGSPAYKYAEAKRDLLEDVEKVTPPAVESYQVERRTERIEKLEAVNQELESKVVNSENVYGKNTEPIKEVVITAPREDGETKPDLILPLIILGGAAVVTVVVTLVFSGK